MKKLVVALTLAFCNFANAEFPKAEEQWFSLDEANNLKAVEESFGKFSKNQKEFLEKHRFLLVPRTELKAPEGEMAGNEDEMLAAFDAITTPFTEYYEEDNHPKPKPKYDMAGARLFNPDIYQHALHMYFYRRMKYLEENILSSALENVLKNLVDNALKNATTEEEKLVAAELLVPYLILNNGLADKSEILTNEDGFPADNQDSGNDTLENTLEGLENYKSLLGDTLTKNVEQELTKIFKAEGLDSPTFTGWSSNVENLKQQNSIDYTAFKPRGYYIYSPALRSWFRAMIWLGQSGFNLEDETGLKSALIFAALVENTTNNAKRPENDYVENELVYLPTKEAINKIMDITAIFHGVADIATPKEWITFLNANLDNRINLDIAKDNNTSAKIKTSLKNLKASNQTFAGLREENPTTTLSMFPSRFTLPYAIAEELSGANKVLPRFSSLLVAATLNNTYALDNLKKEVASLLAKCLTADKELKPQNCEPLNEKTVVENTTELLKKEIKNLQTKIGNLSKEEWESSIATARFKIFATLNQKFGKGYPLYMQDELFNAKQLESLLGAYTELKYDTVLYEKPNYGAEGDGGEYEENLPPISFVEPNLAFWQELNRQVDLIIRLFKENHIFDNDVEEYGVLSQFKESVELCLKIAEKELKGEKISPEEIKKLYDTQLSHMASPVGNATITEDEWRSGVIVDIHNVSLGDYASITYNALGVPYYMFALVGEGKNKRIVSGLAYNHYEFTTDFGERLTDNDWKPKAYAGTVRGNGDCYDEEKGEWIKCPIKPKATLPKKKFWYQNLLVE